MKLLFKNAANIEAKNERGRTALLRAGVAEVLLRAGGNAGARDAKGLATRLTTLNAQGYILAINLLRGTYSRQVVLMSKRQIAAAPQD